MKRRLSEAVVAKIMDHLLERFGEPIGSAQGDRQGPTSTGGKKKDMGNRGFGAKFEASMPAACDQCGGMMGMDEVGCTSCGQMAGEMMGPGSPKAPPSVPVEPKPASTAIVVVGGSPNPRGTKPGASSKGISPSVHPPQGMDGIPETGSGRGSQAPKAAPPVATPMPKPMPAELPMPAAHAEPKPMPATLDQASSEPKPPASIAKEVKPKPMSGSMDEDEELDEKAPPGREKQVRTLKRKKGVDNPYAVAWSSYNKSHGDE